MQTDSSFKGRKLANDTRVLCASPDYLHRFGVLQHPVDLAAHQLIGFRDNAPRYLVSAFGEQVEFNPRQSQGRMIIDDGLSLKVATIAGAGISVSSLWCVHQELVAGTLIRVLPDFVVKDDSVLWLVYPKSNVLTAKVRVFIDFLMNRIGDTPIWEQMPMSGFSQT